MPVNILARDCGPKVWIRNNIFGNFTHILSKRDFLSVIPINTNSWFYYFLQITPKVEMKCCKKCPGIHIPPLPSVGEFLSAFNDMQWREVEKDWLIFLYQNDSSENIHTLIQCNAVHSVAMVNFSYDPIHYWWIPGGLAVVDIHYKNYWFSFSNMIIKKYHGIVKLCKLCTRF